MATIASLQVDLTGNLSGLSQSLSDAGKRLDAFANKTAAIGGAMSKALTAPITAFAGLSVRAFGVQEDAERKLAAAIRATGGEVDANMTRFKAFASQLQAVTVVGDETTLKLLQMATAQGLSADSAERAARNAIAMQAAFGVNAESAIRMTAALEQGEASMLKRYIPALRGVEDETLLVAKAQEILAGAFTIAEAEALTSTGQIKQLKNSYGDLMEEIGSIISNAIQPLVKWLSDVVVRFQALDVATKRNIVAYGALAAAIGPALVAISAITKALLLLATPIALKIIAIGALAAAINYVTLNAEAFAQRLTYFFDQARNAVISATSSMITSLANLVKHFNVHLYAALVTSAAVVDTFKTELADPSGFTEFGGFIESITHRIGQLNEWFIGLIGNIGITRTEIDGANASMESFRTTVQGLTVANQQLAASFAMVTVPLGTMPDAIVRSQVALEVLQPISDRFVNSFGDGMANIVVQGESVVDTLKNIGKLLASAAIQQGIKLLLSGGLSQAGTGFFGSGGGLLGAIFGGITGTSGAMQISGQLIGQGTQLVGVVDNSRRMYR
jgi:hypothetical protein